MDIKEYLLSRKLLVEDKLQHLLTADERLKDHVAAMKYSLMAGGKRLRPVLCIAALEALHADVDPFIEIACALECIHTYSLIHDDLPAMDDDDLRRGKPTNHKVFGEAAAILAGDGLLTFAFELLSNPNLSPFLPPERLLRIVNTIARAAGSTGMVGGQSLDVMSEGQTVSLETLQYIHSCKTGALITASVQTGAILANATAEQYESLTSYAAKIGLAFQIADDILNVEGTTEELGKAAGSDAVRQKATYPALLGMTRAKALADEVVSEAISSLVDFDSKADPLRSLAIYIIKRKK